MFDIFVVERRQKCFDVIKMPRRYNVRLWHCLAPWHLCQQKLIFQTLILKTKLMLEMPFLFNFKVPFLHLDNLLVILFLRSYQPVKIKLFDAKLADSKNSKNVKKWARKSIQHYVLVWDKEIPPTDQHNFVRNLSLISDKLFWSSGGIPVPHQYIWRILSCNIYFFF